MSRKRLLFAVVMLPVTMPFAVLHAFIEWWHFGPSDALLGFCRSTANKRDQWFNSLDEAASKGGGKPCE